MQVHISVSMIFFCQRHMGKLYFYSAFHSQCAACQVTVRPFGIYFLILTGRLYITPHIKDLRRLGWAIQYNGNFCNIPRSYICYEHLFSVHNYSGLGLKYSGLSDPTILLVTNQVQITSTMSQPYTAKTFLLFIIYRDRATDIWAFTWTTDWTGHVTLRLSVGRDRAHNFLRKLRSFNVCRNKLRVFWQSVMASAILFEVICRGSSIRARDSKKLKKMMKAGSVLGTALETLELVVERSMLRKLLNIMGNTTYPPNNNNLYIL